MTAQNDNTIFVRSRVASGFSAGGTAIVTVGETVAAQRDKLRGQTYGLRGQRVMSCQVRPVDDSSSYFHVLKC